VPPTRIERATRGLGMEPVEEMKGSVFQMVSPFYIWKLRLRRVPVALPISMVLVHLDDF
jgi:hypothetical protein